ncbi:MAG: hypothetical protein K6F99_11300 [Lachnospiraceae bacterium]|nr:hypothetical protein [Lachnospiraceae bacterium]
MQVKPGSPYPIGVSSCNNGINIAVVNPFEGELKLVLNDIHGGKKEISFPKGSKVGQVHFMCIEDIDTSSYTYSFRAGKEHFIDPYAYRLKGTMKWGHYDPTGAYFPAPYNWEGDEVIKRDFSKMIMYLIHVRGFTAHRSSGVKHRGTFEGLVEKLPYIKNLGVNAIELMPPYDFNEVFRLKPANIEEVNNPVVADEPPKERQKIKLNYWGFTEGAQMAPKNSYSAYGDGDKSFKDMVRAFHKEGIQVLIQLYFPKGVGRDFIVHSARRWVSDYHVDGLRILGESVPKKTLIEDPYLKDTHIIFDELNSVPAEMPGENTAVLNEAFLRDNRKFLKSDADMLDAFVRHQFEGGGKPGSINFISSYYGFTMNDMVTFDAKHNEDNGEHNIDGSEYNYSWNCGIEGNTRRKAVEALRQKQLKNAFVYLMLAQGTPEFVAGDEFRNSQKGNNNAYCQDNSITWLNWNDLNKHAELTDFVRTLIKLRTDNSVFCRKDKVRLSDFKSLGHPDVSLHGEMAWAPRLENYNRHIGIMYNGAYAEKASEADKDYYIAYNMHWQKHKFSLPKPPKGRRWKVLMTTSGGFNIKPESLKETDITVPERSIVMLVASK